MPASSRARAAREARRIAQFGKFRNVHLNLVPLVDTFVAIVFFALTSQTLGEVAPIAPGVEPPTSRIDAPAAEELTLGVGQDVTLNRAPVMTIQQAASARSNRPDQPLLIPQLLAALQTTADSIRRANDLASDQSVDVKLAIQGDKSVRYDLLSRVIQTARLAGFRNVTLQVLRDETGGETQAQAAT